MRNLIFFFVLISFCAFSQKTPATLISENDATTYSAPFRIRNAFNDQILSNVNQRTPVFLDSADITKRIKWFINGSHPTATTYNVTLPNKSGTVAFLDDITGLTEVKAGNGVESTGDSVYLVGGVIQYNSGYINRYDDDNYVEFNTSGGYHQRRGQLGLNYIFVDETPTNALWNFNGVDYMSISPTEFNVSSADIVFSSIPDDDDGFGSILLRNSSGFIRKLGIGTGLSVSGGNLNAAGGGSSVLSDITAATGSNTINSGANAQEWQWNSLTSGTGFLLSSSSTAAASNTQTVFRVNQTGANATSTQTTYSGYFSNTKTGTSSTNIGLYAEASGGTNNHAFDIGNGGFRWTSGNLQSQWTLNRASSNEGAIRIENTANDRRNGITFYNANAGGSAVASLNFTNNAGSLAYIGLASSGNTSTFGSASALGIMSQQATELTFGTNNVVRQRIKTTGQMQFENYTASTSFSGTPVGYLQFDASGNIITAAVPTSYTFTNGLTNASGTIKLGGALTENTTLTGNFQLNVGNSGNRINYYQLYTTNSILLDATSPITFNSTGSINNITSDAVLIDADSAMSIGNILDWKTDRTNITQIGSKDVESSSELFVKAEDGSETNISGKLTPKLESGTSFTLDASHISKGTYTSNGSAVTITVPSTLPTGAVVTIMQEGAGTVSLSAGANVNIAGKTSTTGANDFIWLWLYKKDGGTSYYVGR